MYCLTARGVLLETWIEPINPLCSFTVQSVPENFTYRPNECQQGEVFCEWHFRSTAKLLVGQFQQNWIPPWNKTLYIPMSTIWDWNSAIWRQSQAHTLKRQKSKVNPKNIFWIILIGLRHYLIPNINTKQRIRFLFIFKEKQYGGVHYLPFIHQILHKWCTRELSISRSRVTLQIESYWIN